MTLSEAHLGRCAAYRRRRRPQLSVAARVDATEQQQHETEHDEATAAAFPAAGGTVRRRLFHYDDTVDRARDGHDAMRAELLGHVGVPLGFVSKQIDMCLLSGQHLHL